MSASGDVSFFSRFLVKFAEIIAAGLATAVSGYLIAHLSGAWSSPVPAPARAVVQDTLNASPPAQPSPPVSGDLDEQHPAPKQDVTSSPVPQLARPANTTKIAAPRKHTETATSATESKHDQKSLVARVRAALGSVDANRTEPLEVRSDVRPESAGVASQARPSADSSRGAVIGAAPPSTGELGPVPAQQTQPNPLTAVEVQSRPVAAVEPSPTPPAEKETGILSNLEDMLRHDPLAGSEEAPRPPLPVGQ
jgi:hypothetical protein